MSHLAKATYAPEDIPMLRTTPIYVGKFFPTDQEFEFISTTGSRLGAQAMECGWHQLPTAQQLALPVPKGLEDGMEVANNTDLLTDHSGEVQRLKKLKSGIEQSDSGVAERIVEFLDNFDEPVDSSSIDESVINRTRQFVDRTPMLRSAINPEASPVQLAESIRTLEGLASLIQPTMENQDLIQVAQNQIIDVQKSKDSESENLASEIHPHIKALNGLRAIGELAGDGRMPGFIVNVKDHHQLFGAGLGRFIKALQARKRPFFDLVVLDDFYGETAFLRGVGEQLEKSLQTSLWASIATGDEAETIAYAAANPTAASTGAGSVFSYVGEAFYKGCPVAPSAAVYGNRLRLDLSPQGQLTAHWGPQANKALSQITADTLDWDEETLQMIAQEAGLNGLWRYNNQNVSPYVGRTLSSLPDYRMIDEGRTASLIEGFSTEYLSLNSISEPAELCVVRAQCERAEEIYAEPFRRSHAGFECKILPAGLDGPEARVDIVIAAKDPIERIITTRRGGRSESAA